MIALFWMVHWSNKYAKSSNWTQMRRQQTVLRWDRLLPAHRLPQRSPVNSGIRCAGILMLRLLDVTSPVVSKLLQIMFTNKAKPIRGLHRCSNIIFFCVFTFSKGQLWWVTTPKWELFMYKSSTCSNCIVSIWVYEWTCVLFACILRQKLRYFCATFALFLRLLCAIFAGKILLV